MQRIPPLLFLAFAAFASSGHTAPPVAKVPGTVAEVALAPGALTKPIGVEPEGGRFEQLLAADLKPAAAGTGKFNVDRRDQARSTLAIYQSETNSIHEEKPLARLEVIGLRTGEVKDRIRVKLTVVSTRLLTVEAWDLPGEKPLSIRLLDAREVKQTRFGGQALPPPIAAADQKPPPIASRDTTPVTAAGLPQAVGVRSAGGLFLPLLPTGAKPGTTRAYYLRPRYADQTSADVSFFTGDSPYMENNKLWQRLLISGLPAGENRRIKIDLTVGPDGKLASPKATEMTTKQELKIEGYSDSAAHRLNEAPRESAPTVSRKIPAAPIGEVR